MIYKTASAPFLRRTDRVSMMNNDVLIALVPLCIFSAVHYGMRPVLLVLTGMVAAMLCEAFCCLLMRRKPTVTDSTAAVTGGLVGALMSPLAPYWMPAAGAAFAILIVKMPMGGSGRNVFNPAAAGVAALTLCFSRTMFLYPNPGLNTPLPLTGSLDAIVSETSPAAQLMRGGQSVYSGTMVLLGDIPGPIGATGILILLTCGLYLFACRSISCLITLPYLATCALLAFLFPRTGAGATGSILIELCSGYLLFGGIFLLNDPVTSPRHWLGRIVYGIFAGLLVMQLRYFGRFEEGVCFAVLLVNAFATTIDRLCWYLVNLRRVMKRRSHS